MGEKKISADFWWGDVKKRGHLKHLSLDATRAYIKMNLKSRIHFAQVRHQRRAVVNTTMNFRFPNRLEEFTD
jgi:uncharacterized protein (DUF952 family)